MKWIIVSIIFNFMISIFFIHSFMSQYEETKELKIELKMIETKLKNQSESLKPLYLKPTQIPKIIYQKHSIPKEKIPPKMKKVMERIRKLNPGKNKN